MLEDEVPTLWQRRVKAGTAVACVAATVVLLLHDWGEGNVFSGIRPALKRRLNQAYYGTDKPAAQPDKDSPRQQQ